MPDRNLLLHEIAALKWQLAQRSRSLAEAEARFEAVFASAHNQISICTVDGVVLDVNRTALEAAGLQIEDLVGKHLWETPWFARNPEEAAKLEATIRKHRGKFTKYETCVLSSQKDWRRVQFILRPYRAHPGGETRFLVIEGRGLPAAREDSQAAASIGEVRRSWSDPSNS